MAEPGVSDEAKSEVLKSPNVEESERTLPLEALSNYIQGKRHLLVQDYTFAVPNLEKACELYASHYGETATECGEVYFHYGKALFRLSQEESGVLGDVLPEGSNDDEDEENESGSEEDKETAENGSDDEDEEDAEDSEEIANDDKMDADTSSQGKVESSENKDSDNMDGKKDAGDAAFKAETSEAASTKAEEKHAGDVASKAETSEAASTKAEEKHAGDATSEAASTKAEEKHADEATFEAASTKAEEKHADEVTSEAASTKAGKKHADEATFEAASTKAEEKHAGEVTSEAASTKADDATFEAASTKAEEKHAGEVTSEAASTKAEETHAGDATSKGETSEAASTKVDEKPASGGSNVIDCGPSGSSTQPKPSEAEEEITDLQLAWEALETAKSIYKRQGENNREAQLKVAEILLILAEISMESENYPAAIEDLKECLQLHQLYLNADDRLIAETYYQIGLAYSFDSQFTVAIENFKSTLEVIHLRIRSLKTQTVPEKSGGFDIDPAIEIAELERLLPDIREKIEDTQDMMARTKKEFEEFAFQKIEEVKMEQVSSSSSSSAKPITNISHLLKRKKPEDQDSSSKSTEVKKIKLCSHVMNGDKAVPDSTSFQSVL